MACRWLTDSEIVIAENFLWKIFLRDTSMQDMYIEKQHHVSAQEFSPNPNGDLCPDPGFGPLCGKKSAVSNWLMLRNGQNGTFHGELVRTHFLQNRKMTLGEILSVNFFVIKMWPTRILKCEKIFFLKELSPKTISSPGTPLWHPPGRYRCQTGGQKRLKPVFDPLFGPKNRL